MKAIHCGSWQLHAWGNGLDSTHCTVGTAGNFRIDNTLQHISNTWQLQSKLVSCSSTNYLVTSSCYVLCYINTLDFRKYFQTNINYSCINSKSWQNSLCNVLSVCNKFSVSPCAYQHGYGEYVHKHVVISLTHQILNFCTESDKVLERIDYGDCICQSQSSKTSIQSWKKKEV